MSSTKTIWIAATAVVIASGLATGMSAAWAAEPHGTERHCVIAVTAVQDGVLVTAPEVCFATPDQADRHVASWVPRRLD